MTEVTETLVFKLLLVIVSIKWAEQDKTCIEQDNFKLYKTLQLKMLA